MELKHLVNAEDFFEYFGIEYDERLVNTKRLHILREFGILRAKIDAQSIENELKREEFYKVALLSIYGAYKNGHAPNAAEVWGMFERTGGCLSCSTVGQCQTKETENGTCSTQVQFSFTA